MSEGKDEIVEVAPSSPSNSVSEDSTQSAADPPDLNVEAADQQAQTQEAQAKLHAQSAKQLQAAQTQIHQLAKAVKKEKKKLDILREAYKKLSKESKDKIDVLQKENFEIKEELYTTMSTTGYQKEIDEAIRKTKLENERTMAHLHKRLAMMSEDRGNLRAEMARCICGRKTEEQIKQEEDEKKAQEQKEEEEEEAQIHSGKESKNLATCTFEELCHHLEKLQRNRRVELTERISLLSYRGKYLSRTVSLISKYPFVANRDDTGSWEKFTTVEIKGDDDETAAARFAFISCAGHYVEATSDGYLKSGSTAFDKSKRRRVPKQCEIFELRYSSYAEGSKVSLRSIKTMKYVGVAKGGGVLCKASSVSQWEWWTVVKDTEPEVRESFATQLLGF